MVYCQKCGSSVNGEFCNKCGSEANGAQVEPVQQGGLKCPKCSSSKVVVTVENTGGKTKQRGNGCLWSIGRFFLIFITCGLWLLVGKRKGSAKTKFVNQTVAICQNCGNKWVI